MRIGTWNIRTLRPETLHAITSETERYNIDILGIAEHRLAGSGYFRPEAGGKFMYSGAEKAGLHGVTFYISKRMERAFIGYDPISERLMTIRIRATPFYVTFVQGYAPTSAVSDDEIKDFCHGLQKILFDVKKRHTGSNG